LDEDLRESFYLDGIVTVIDSRHLFAHLDQDLTRADSRQVYQTRDTKNEPFEQIVVADRILLNKVDLTSEDELQACELAIR